MQCIVALQAEEKQRLHTIKVDEAVQYSHQGSTTTILDRLKSTVNRANTENFLLGTFVGTFCKVAWYPFEKISVHQQTDVSKPSYGSAAKQVLGNGWRVAYKGLAAQGVSSLAGSAGYLGVAMHFKRDDAPVFENALRCGMYSMMAEQFTFAHTAAYIRETRGLAPWAVSSMGWGRIFTGFAIRHIHGNPLTLGTIWTIEKGLDDVFPSKHPLSSLAAGAAGVWAVHRCGLASLASNFAIISCNPEQTLKQSWKQMIKQGSQAGGDARAFNRILISSSAFFLFRVYDKYIGKGAESKGEKPALPQVATIMAEETVSDHSQGLKQA